MGGGVVAVPVAVCVALLSLLYVTLLELYVQLELLVAMVVVLQEVFLLLLLMLYFRPTINTSCWWWW